MAKSRRANHEGTVYFDEKIQRFVGQFRYIDPQTGKQKRKKFTDKRQVVVRKKGKEFLQKMENLRNLETEPEGVKKGTVLLGSYMKDWLEYTVKPTIRQKTYERYECTLRRYILPNISDIPIADLTRITLQKFLSEIALQGGQEGKKLSPSTVNAVRRLIKTALDFAVADGLFGKQCSQFDKGDAYREKKNGNLYNRRIQKVAHRRKKA